MHSNRYTAQSHGISQSVTCFSLFRYAVITALFIAPSTVVSFSQDATTVEENPPTSADTPSEVSPPEDSLPSEIVEPLDDVDTLDEDMDEAGELDDEELAEENEPKVNPAIEKLVQQLGDNNFEKREAATNQLVLMGMEVVQPLKAHQRNSSDPEVIARIAMIVQTLETSELPGRIDAFMQHPGKLDDHEFFGWPEFSKYVGTNRASRRFFLQMLENHPRICFENLQDPAVLKEVSQATIKSVLERFSSRMETTVGDAIALQYMMLLLSDQSTGDLETAAVALVGTYPYTAELKDERVSKVAKRFTGNWLATIKLDPVRPLLIGLEFKVPEIKDLASRLLQDRQVGIDAYTLAMQTLLVFGNEENLPLVESWLKDDRSIFKMNTIENNEVVMLEQKFQDLALAACVSIRGLEMREFFPTALPHPIRGYMPNSIGFTERTGERIGAFAKYQAIVDAEQSSN